MKNFLRNNIENIKRIKTFLAVLLALMVVIDIVLVALGSQGWPTFSKVVVETEQKLVWLTFLMGGLVAKIFYNRQVVGDEDRELSGFASFVALVFIIFLMGQFDVFPENVSNPIQLVVLLMGGFVAHGIWPQYVPREDSN